MSITHSTISTAPNTTRPGVIGSLAWNADHKDTESIKYYGAVGDGTTDDSAALTAALTALAGATLHIPEGTYVVHGITITSPLTITGVGTLKAKPGVAGHLISATNVDGITIQGVRFDGNHTNRTGDGAALYFDGCDDLTLDNVRVTNAYGTLISDNGGSIALKDCANAEIANCFVTNGKYNGLAIFGSVGGGNRVIGGKYSGNGYSGVSTLTSPNNTIQGVVAENNGTSNITINGPYNIASGCIARGSVAHHGINVGHATATNQNADGCKVIGCVANANAVYGINVEGSDTYPHNGVSVVGCEAFDNTDAGIRLLGDYCPVIGCHSYSNGTDGIVVGSGTEGGYNIVEGCVSRGNTRYGLYIASGRATRVSGNTIIDNPTNTIDSGSGTIIDGNIKVVSAMTNTSGTAETVLAAASIPAGMLGKGGGFRVTAAGDKTGTANNKRIRLTFGGASFVDFTVNDTLDWVVEVECVNVATNAQRAIGRLYNGTSLAYINCTGFTIDTTASNNIELRATCTDGTDKVISRLLVVDLIPERG